MLFLAGLRNLRKLFRQLQSGTIKMYECYLGGILMPITPAKFSVKIKGKNSTVTLLNGEEINILKSPGLSELTVPLVFPMVS